MPKIVRSILGGSLGLNGLIASMRAGYWLCVYYVHRKTPSFVKTSMTVHLVTFIYDFLCTICCVIYILLDQIK